MTEHEFIAAIAAMNAEESEQRAPQPWSVVVRLFGVVEREITVQATEDTIDRLMLDAAPFAAEWHRGGTKRDQTGKLVAVRVFATHRRQSREIVATLAA